MTAWVKKGLGNRLYYNAVYFLFTLFTFAFFIHL